MPISLANFLNSDSSEPKRDGRSPPPAPLASPPSPQAAPAPAKGASQGRVALPEIQELKALLGELSGEWSCVVQAIQDLKQDLARDPGVVVEAPPRRSPAPEKLDKAPPPPPASSAPPLAAATLPSKPPTSGPEIDAKLGELLKLLRDNVAKKGGGSQAVEISQDVTQQIAREVAGRVKQTVLESLQQGARAPESTADQGSPKPNVSKRIPLDDLGAIIDQITGQNF